MSAILFANNAVSVLAGALSPSSTVMTVAPSTGSQFPAPTGGDYFVATLSQAANPLTEEIVHVTGRVGDSMTIVRARESTTALSWAAGDIVANYWTAGQASTLQSNSGNGSGVPQLPISDFDGTTNLYSVIMDSLATYSTALFPPLEPGAFGLIGTQLRVADLQSLVAIVPFSCPLKMKDAFGTASMILNANTNPADIAHMDRVVLSGLRLLGNYTNQSGTPGTGTSCLVELRAVKNSVIDIIGEDAFSDVIYWGPATGNPALIGQNNIWRVRGKNYAGRNTATIIALQGGRGEVYPEGFQLHGLDVEANTTANITQGMDLLVVGGNGGGGYGAGNSYLCATAGIAPMSDLNLTVISTGGVTGGLYGFRNVQRLRANVRGAGFSVNGIVGLNGGSTPCTGKITGAVQVDTAGNGFIDISGNSQVNTDDLQIVQGSNFDAFAIAFGAASRHTALSVIYKTGAQVGVGLYGCVGVELISPYVKGAYQSYVLGDQAGTHTTDCVLRDPVSDSAVNTAVNEQAGSDRNNIQSLKQIGTAKTVTITGANSTATGAPLKGSAVWDPPSVASGASALTTVTVAGIVNGQNYQFSANLNLSGGLLGCTLNADNAGTNTANVVLSNLTGTSKDLGSATLTVIATPTY